MKAIIVQGGWLGHEPKLVAEIFRAVLNDRGWEAEVYDSLEVFAEKDLLTYDLIVPIWTMGTIARHQLYPVLEAVEEGVGIAGCHGGMCDSFRDAIQWQLMTGGQWVSHPGGDGVPYTVSIRKGSHPIVEGIEDFTVRSEQYYMHVDPAVRVLATTRVPVPGFEGPHSVDGPVDMPVVWIKHWGRGRVFYCSLGHKAAIVMMPETLRLMVRGFEWAAEGKRLAPQAAYRKTDLRGWY
jgi:uncharacterized protein